MLPEPDFDEVATLPGFKLRDYQQAAVDAVEAGWATSSRQLIVHATGTGKGSLAAYYGAWAKANGKRMLFLAHRESLVRQTAKRIEAQGGVEAFIEMADEYAPPEATVVCASVQTICNHGRLTSFDDTHFDLILADEGHHSLATSWQRVLNYFHFGAHSLNEGWELPKMGEVYVPKARVIGLTATPDLASKKELGSWYSSIAHQFNLLDAVREGWLVRPVLKSIPLEIDLRGLSARRTSHGSDISDQELSDRLYPVIDALAKQICKMVPDRKTVCFLPSIKCAELLAEAISGYGLRGMFVSGEMDDSQEILEQFTAAPKGTVICNASLITEGVDIPDVSCVVMARATKSRGFYAQCAGRASRPLSGLVDKYATLEERRAAIAASAKANFLILDPLWVSDRLQLVQGYSLVTSRPEVDEFMDKEPAEEKDLAELATEAERDFLAALEKEAKKHAKKKAREIDPLAWAVTLSDASLSGYRPETALDARPPASSQLAFIRSVGLNPASITCYGMASKIIDKVASRNAMGLATPKMLQLILQLGVEEEKAVTMTRGQAGAIIARKGRWRR